MNKQTNIHYREQKTPPLDTLEPSPHFTIRLPKRLGLPKVQFLMYLPSLTCVLNAPPVSLSLTPAL